METKALIEALISRERLMASETQADPNSNRYSSPEEYLKEHAHNAAARRLQFIIDEATSEAEDAHFQYELSCLATAAMDKTLAHLAEQKASSGSLSARESAAMYARLLHILKNWLPASQRRMIELMNYINK